VHFGAPAATAGVSVRDTTHLWGEISDVAAAQHGHVTRRQLIALGVSTTSVGRWAAAGRLIRVHAGVYAVGYRRVEPVATAMAAVLACGDGALLSHDSAAALYGWRRWPHRPEVTSARERRRHGIWTHHSRSLLTSDGTHELDVPVTTPARTIRDLRPRLTERQFTRMVNDARRERRIDDEAVTALLGYASGPTRSEFEAVFLRFCRRYGLPAPQTLVVVAGYEVDALFDRQRVVVELDGWQYHNDRTAFGSDRERDAALLAVGYRTVRITWDRLRDEPDREAARLRAILAR
jgi:Transcriptional regulator, AbiEi antitoxin/Protein of unknown function (DUF559)